MHTHTYLRTHAADLKIEQPPDTDVRGYGTQHARVHMGHRCDTLDILGAHSLFLGTMTVLVSGVTSTGHAEQQ